MSMLTLIALSALLMQEPPAPPAPPPPPAPPEFHTRMMVMGPDGPGGLDKDGDGQISREEFAAPMNDHFARLDKDSDGRLSTEEMAAGHGGGQHEVMIRRGPGAHSEHEVRTIVVTGGGEGGPGEHNVIVRQLGGPDGEHKMDTDNDGRISEAEFTGPLREAFARMDADHSGFIEEGERGQEHEVQVFTHRVETRQNRED